MSEKKALVYDCGDGSAKAAAELALKESGFSTLSSADKAALTEADFLVLAASDASQLGDKKVEELWSFFLDEIKWKRKNGGEVVIIDCSEISFSPSRLAYALKKCKRYRLSQLSDAVKYMSSGEEKSVAPNRPQYAPKPDFEEVAKKPSAPSVKKESGACRDDHVFGDDKGHKSYVRDEDGKKCEDDHAFGGDKGKGYKKYVRDTAAEESEDDDAPEENEDDLVYTVGKEKKYELFHEYPDIEKDDKPQFGKNKLKGLVILIFIIVGVMMFLEVCSSIGMAACAGAAMRQGAAALSQTVVKAVGLAVKPLRYLLIL